jgi:hypothetical protein
MNKPTIEEGCKISKQVQRRIDILCELGFDITVMPKNHYKAFGPAYENSYNYLGEGLTYGDCDLEYRHIIPDNISDRQMVDMIKMKLHTHEHEGE